MRRSEEKWGGVGRSGRWEEYEVEGVEGGRTRKVDEAWTTVKVAGNTIKIDAVFIMMEEMIGVRQRNKETQLAINPHEKKTLHALEEEERCMEGMCGNVSSSRL